MLFWETLWFVLHYYTIILKQNPDDFKRKEQVVTYRSHSCHELNPGLPRLSSSFIFPHYFSIISLIYLFLIYSTVSVHHKSISWPTEGYRNANYLYKVFVVVFFKLDCSVQAITMEKRHLDLPVSTDKYMQQGSSTRHLNKLCVCGNFFFCIHILPERNYQRARQIKIKMGQNQNRKPLSL